MNRLQIMFLLGGLGGAILSQVNLVLYHIMISRINDKLPKRFSDLSWKMRRSELWQVAREYDRYFPESRLSTIWRILNVVIITSGVSAILSLVLLATRSE